MDFTDFLSQNVYIVSAALILIGMALKQTPHLPNWSIPYILSVIGIVACNLILGWGIDATLQGVIVTGVSVYAHQLGKQGMECIRCQKTAQDADGQSPQKEGGDAGETAGTSLEADGTSSAPPEQAQEKENQAQNKDGQ